MRELVQSLLCASDFQVDRKNRIFKILVREDQRPFVLQLLPVRAKAFQMRKRVRSAGKIGLDRWKSAARIEFA